MDLNIITILENRYIWRIKVENIRAILHNIAAETGIHSSATLEASRKLDETINEYMRWEKEWRKHINSYHPILKKT